MESVSRPNPSVFHLSWASLKAIRIALRHSIHHVGWVTELEAHGEVISSIAPAYHQQVVLPPIGLLGFIRRQMLPAMYPHYRESFYGSYNDQT